MLAGMARRSRPRRRWFLQDWRKFRKLSQEALAAKVGLTQGMISQLETNRADFTATHLDNLASALGCTPADLLTRRPQDGESPLSIWEQLPERERGRALEILQLLRRQPGE